MKYYYHYTELRHVASIIKDGMYPTHPVYTTEEYFHAHTAQQLLGVSRVECVLKFRDDGTFKPGRPPIVDVSNRFMGGGLQFETHLRPRPIAQRLIVDHLWTDIKIDG